MNEDELLESQNIEDINIEVESEDLEQNTNEDVLEDLSLDDEPKTIDESFEDSIDSLDEVIPENEIDIDLPEIEESEAIDEFLEEDIKNEDISIEDLDISEESEEKEEDSLEIEEDVSNEAEIEELDLNCEEESLEEEDTKEILEEDSAEESDELAITNEQEDTEEAPIVEEEIQEIEEPSIQEEELEVEEEISSELSLDENLITNDLNNIKIEFGIEAKGFILSVNMMEAMIQKGYIFKDMLNDKVFDAVMIFNGNLENTVVTNDIKIKIEDGKIQLIKG